MELISGLSQLERSCEIHGWEGRAQSGAPGPGVFPETTTVHQGGESPGSLAAHEDGSSQGASGGHRGGTKAGSAVPGPASGQGQAVAQRWHCHPAGPCQGPLGTSSKARLPCLGEMPRAALLALALPWQCPSHPKPACSRTGLQGCQALPSQQGNAIFSPVKLLALVLGSSASGCIWVQLNPSLRCCRPSTLSTAQDSPHPEHCLASQSQAEPVSG